ncbi:hypothetical protein AQUCO_07200088v1 [Aquilegia coerulea]|uniref:KIB1-4 beta-propeller domain-containing protein n=1 Tax=Aquilegia coerulea TaxID=218851 RepID=A0A2G5CA98_AQUCA|nr:hypothetical protein AQUCO_07200088v1 [Aquilegia coerulea]
MDRSLPLNWLDLPDHIQAFISEKLVHIKDYIRFGAVCHSWHSIYTQNPHRHLMHRQLPVLMLSSDYGKTKIYDLSSERVHKIPVRVREYYEYSRCSTEGWLVSKPVIWNPSLHLFNPFLSVANKIELPWLLSNFYFDKVVLSANPASNPHFVVMAFSLSSVCSDNRKMAVYKPGYEAWKFLDCKCNKIQDVIYYRHQFYVLDCDGAVWACNATCPHLILWNVVQVPPLELKCVGRRMYLVESSGVLLQVTRIWKQRNGYNLHPHLTVTAEFKVFKLEQVALNWVEMTTLGGQTLFLGDNTSMSILASDFPGCKPNCIYFTDEGFGDTVGEFGYIDMGVYNVENGSTEPHYPQNYKTVRNPAPFWIEPTLGASSFVQ